MIDDPGHYMKIWHVRLGVQKMCTHEEERCTNGEGPNFIIICFEKSAACKLKTERIQFKISIVSGQNQLKRKWNISHVPFLMFKLVSYNSFGSFNQFHLYGGVRFVRSCPDFRAFFLVSRPCKFERTTPPSCVHLGLDISTFRLGPQPGYWHWGEHSALVFIPIQPKVSNIEFSDKSKSSLAVPREYVLV